MHTVTTDSPCSYQAYLNTSNLTECQQALHRAFDGSRIKKENQSKGKNEVWLESKMEGNSTIVMKEKGGNSTCEIKDTFVD